MKNNEGIKDTDMILASVKQQELYFKRLTQKLENEKKLKRKSFTAFENRNMFENYELSDTESKRDAYYQNCQKKSTSCIGIPTIHQTQNEKEPKSPSQAFYTVNRRPMTSYEPLSSQCGDDVIINRRRRAGSERIRRNVNNLIYHHNYQDHVSQLMQMQQKLLIEGSSHYPMYPMTSSPQHHYLMTSSFNQPRHHFSPFTDNVIKRKPSSNLTSPRSDNTVESPSTVKHHHDVTKTSPRDLLRHHSNRLSFKSDQLYLNDNSISVKISEVIKMLFSSSSQNAANAAAYIQHITFADDIMKSILRKKGVIPILVDLLLNPSIEVQKNTLGALRNLIFGKANNEGKILLRNCGGLLAICKLVEDSEDVEIKELATGVLWNLSSCEHLKQSVTDSTLKLLTQHVIIKYAYVINPKKMSKFLPSHLQDTIPDGIDTSDVAIIPDWKTLFLNATGCLRNISSAGSEVRQQMRSHPGLIESLLLIIENVIGKSDVDSKGVENCASILRNLSYHLATEVEAAYQPLIAPSNQRCWRRKTKKKAVLKDAEAEGVALLWHPSVARRYLALLADTCNQATLEAAAGALQNLSAGEWVWSAGIRAMVRRLKGLPMLVRFLHVKNDRIVHVICCTLRNLLLDERNKQLIGKHAMSNFLKLFSEFESSSLGSHEANWKKLDALLVTIKELLTNNPKNSSQFFTLGGVPHLFNITKSQTNTYPTRIVKMAEEILGILWKNKSVKSQLKNEGLKKKDFFVDTTSNGGFVEDEMMTSPNYSLNTSPTTIKNSSKSDSFSSPNIRSFPSHHFHLYMCPAHDGFDSWV